MNFPEKGNVMAEINNIIIKITTIFQKEKIRIQLNRDMKWIEKRINRLKLGGEIDLSSINEL